MNFEKKNQSNSKQQISDAPKSVTVESKVFVCPSFGMYGKRPKYGFVLGKDNINSEDFLVYLRDARAVTIKVNHDIYTKNIDAVFSLREQLEVLGFSAFVSVIEVTA